MRFLKGSFSHRSEGNWSLQSLPWLVGNPPTFELLSSGPAEEEPTKRNTLPDDKLFTSFHRPSDIEKNLYPDMRRIVNVNLLHKSWEYINVQRIEQKYGDVSILCLLCVHVQFLCVLYKRTCFRFSTKESAAHAIVATHNTEVTSCFSNTKDKNTCVHIYLLAPTGALIVMMVYYISGSGGNFFRFPFSPLIQLMLQVSLFVA